MSGEHGGKTGNKYKQDPGENGNQYKIHALYSPVPDIFFLPPPACLAFAFLLFFFFSISLSPFVFDALTDEQ